MKQLKESILGNDFDIKGVEMYEYDWLKWPAIKDSNIGQFIIHDNNIKFLSAHIDVLKKNLEQEINALKDMEDLGYCDADIVFKEMKLFKSAITGAAEKLNDIHLKGFPFDPKEYEQFEMLNDIFSDPRLKNIGPKWDSRHFYFGHIHNGPKGDRILISNYADRKEYDLMCDIVSKVCKKRKFEYKTDYGVDSDDEYQIRIYLKR